MQPLTSSLTANGPAELAPDTIVIDPSSVRAVSGDGASFTLVTDQVIGAGTVFVVPGVAARRATAVTPLPTEAATSGRAAVRVETAQATIDEIFASIDVTFAGEPDPASVAFAEAAPSGDAAAPLGEYDPAPGFRRPTEGPAPLRPAAAPPPCAVKDAASIGISSPAFSAGPYKITMSGSAVPDCRAIGFAVTATRGDANAKINATLTGSARVGAVRGRVTNKAGQSSSLSVDLDASLTFSVTGATAASTIDRAKISWDSVKIDVPVVLAGVPVVVRVGFPFSIEARFSGGADTVRGTLLTLACRGTLSIGTGTDTPDDICSMQPADVGQMMSIAPTAIVLAAGVKVGFGVGTVTAGKAVVFVGATATLAGAVGVTYSGGAGIPITECTRIDRSKSLNLGGQVEVLGLTLAVSKPVWTKEATDQIGQRCRPAG